MNGVHIQQKRTSAYNWVSCFRLHNTDIVINAYMCSVSSSYPKILIQNI
uniref:Uncharacterized protein n=1 Tax=Arundo donax TaxID=35708 RepID=A0A0A9HFG4_ARUDO